MRILGCRGGEELKGVGPGFPIDVLFLKLLPEKRSLNLQVSLDAVKFAAGKLPLSTIPASLPGIRCQGRTRLLSLVRVLPDRKPVSLPRECMR
jgi:hypothetical protein